MGCRVIEATPVNQAWSDQKGRKVRQGHPAHLDLPALMVRLGHQVSLV
jgi:hypothetical protein